MNEKPKEPITAVAELTFADAELAKRFFQAIERFTDEPIFHVLEDRITLRQMDPSRVAMLDYVLEKHVFEEWDVHTLGTFCFDVAEILKVVFAKLSKDTKVTLFVDGKDGKATFTLQDTRTRKRSISLLNPHIEEVPIPKVTYHARFKIIAKQWHEDIEDLCKLTDHVTLVGRSDLLKVLATGDVIEGVNEYKLGGDLLLLAEANEECKATYSLAYLKDVGVDPKLCDLATLEFATDMPIKITMRTQIGTLCHYLAPRIEVE